ncbi:MAG: trypsin-like peptidase domain-containing protein [Sandaracinaceae bacterium]
MVRLHQTFGAHAGRVIDLDRDVIRFGRLPDNEVCFDAHADLDASGRHAELRREGGSWVLVDVGSRNGTLVAGQRITRHVVHSGDEIEFGVGGPRVRIELIGAGAGGWAPGIGTPTGPATPVAYSSEPPIAPPRIASSASAISLPIAGNTPPPVVYGVGADTPPPVGYTPASVALPPSPVPGSHPGMGSQPGDRRYGQRTVGMMIQAALNEAERTRGGGSAPQRSTAFFRAIAVEAAQSSSRGLKIAVGLLAFLLLLTLAAVIALFFYARWQEQQLRDENVDLQRQIADLGEGESAQRAHLEERIQELNSQLSERDTQTGVEVASQNDGAVWALIRTTSSRREVLCTAFAVRRDLLATNAHCVGTLERAMSRSETVEAYANRSSTGVHVRQMWRHPRFDDDAPASPDIGLLRIDGQTSQQVRIGNLERLRELAVGDDVFVIGFPSVIAPGGAPVAGLSTGVIGRLTAFDGTAAAPEMRHVLSHSAFSDQGTAGSPIFDREGHVVGINAGNIRTQQRVTDTGTHVTRTVEGDTPVAWGVRADLLLQLLAGLPE